MSAVMRTHSLARTSPKGGDFVGRCELCGATGLPMKAALESCENPFGITADGALLDLLAAPSAEPGEPEK